MYIQKYKYGELYFNTKYEGTNFFKNNNDTYQEYINDMFKKYHRPNSIVLDIGANVGIFSVSFAKLDKSVMVYSFEPVDITYSYLVKNVLHNNIKNIKLFKVGISDKNEETEIYFIDKELGGASITQKIVDRPFETRNIKTITLDSLNLKNVSFIKVDVQDHELYVLMGAKNTLENNDIKIILELPNRNPYEHDLFNKCVKLMNDYGYPYRKKIGKKDHIFSKEPLEPFEPLEPIQPIQPK